MIYRRDAKKGEATYSPKSHSAPHFVGHYVEGMEEWASWYCFNTAIEQEKSELASTSEREQARPMVKVAIDIEKVSLLSSLSSLVACIFWHWVYSS